MVTFEYSRFYNSAGIPTPTSGNWQLDDTWVAVHFAHKDKTLASQAGMEAAGNGFTVHQRSNGGGSNPGRIMVGSRTVTQGDIDSYQNTVLDLGVGTGSDAKYAGGSFIVRDGVVVASTLGFTTTNAPITPPNVTLSQDGLAMSFNGASHGSTVLTSAQGFTEILSSPVTSLAGAAQRTHVAGEVTSPTWDSQYGNTAVMLALEPGAAGGGGWPARPGSEARLRNNPYRRWG